MCCKSFADLGALLNRNMPQLLIQVSQPIPTECYFCDAVILWGVLLLAGIPLAISSTNLGEDAPKNVVPLTTDRITKNGQLGLVKILFCFETHT